MSIEPGPKLSHSESVIVEASPESATRSIPATLAAIKLAAESA